jgi:hypothetical protein
MAVKVISIRVLLCLFIALSTLECCARVDDLLSERVSLFDSWDFTRLIGRDKLGPVGMPHASYYKWRLNSLGFRGPELKEGTFRVACAGSSETFGISEREGGEYPRLLENELNARTGGRRIEVVNLGVPGSSMSSLDGHMPGIVDRLRPDVVTIYPSFAAYIREPSHGPLQETELEFMPPAGSPVSRRSPWWTPRLSGRWDRIADSTIPARARTWWRELRNARVARRLGGSFDKIPEEKVMMFRRDLERLLDYLQRQGIPVVLCTHATSFGDATETRDYDRLVAWREAYPLLKEEGFLDMEQRMNRVVRETAARKGVRLVDASRLMPAGHRYFADFVHFSDDGAQVFAHMLAPAVESAVREKSAGLKNRH